MSNIYFTVTGLHHYYGDSFLEKEMIVYLKKEKDNEYDKEAISVNLPGLGKIGYVATVLIQYLEKVIVQEDCMIKSVKKRVVKLDSY